MAGRWHTTPFDEAVQINPSVPLKRGGIYPFVDMQAVQPSSRDVGPSEHRAFSGGGSRFRVGDTLMARITPCLENGKIARFRDSDGQSVGHGSTEFIVIRGKDGVTDDNFAYYLTRSEIVHGYAISQMTGSSGRQRVPVETLGHLQVAVPPLDEQRAIAHILGTLDDKIELNHRMSETLEAMVRAIFKNQFAETGATGELGKVEDVATISREPISPGGFPEEVFDHYSVPAFDEGRLPKPEAGGEIKSNKFTVPPQAVLLCKLNPRIPRVWLPALNRERRSVCSTEFLVSVPKPGISREYLFGLFSSDIFLERFASFVTGTSGSHQRVKPEYLLAMETAIPTREQVENFTDLAKPLLGRIALNLEESRALAAIRDALLPKLLSGEIRAERIGERPLTT